MKKIVAATSAIALSLSMTSVAFAATDSGNIQLEVEVLDTLSMDCYDAAGGLGDTVVTLGDSTTGAGMVVAGVPSVGKSRCNVTTNDDQGYYLSIMRSTEDVTWAGANGTGQDATATNVLIHEDPNIDGTWYEIPDTLTAYTETTAGNAWVDGTTKGFGFSVVDFPDGGDLAHNALDNNWALTGELCKDGTANDDVALYAGVPSANQAISAVPHYEAGVTTTDVCYKVDVLPTQQSGDYAGQVTFTATSDASAYLVP